MTLSFRAGLILLLFSCAPPGHQSPQSSNEPKIHATVVTIQTSIQPANKTYTHILFIANDRARSGDEVDEWRLFDFAQKRVTFVDDLTGTYRNEPFDEVVTSHRAGMARSVPDGMPRAQFSVTGAQKTLQGVAARQSIIRLGAYQRELWIASHPLIPEGLFAMLQASEPVSSPLAGVMRAVDEALLSVKGFPISDHAELPYENQKLVVDNTIVKIDQRDVPASWLNVRADYRELHPAPAGVGKRPQSE
ncbi:MAG TPA: hypothetical protein VF713_14740 [Thermoanaerobaculia bacterium]